MEVCDCCFVPQPEGSRQRCPTHTHWICEECQRKCCRDKPYGLLDWGATPGKAAMDPLAETIKQQLVTDEWDSQELIVPRRKAKATKYTLKASCRGCPDVEFTVLEAAAHEPCHGTRLDYKCSCGHALFHSHHAASDHHKTHKWH